MAEWDPDSTLAQVFAVTCTQRQNPTVNELCEERLYARKDSGRQNRPSRLRVLQKHQVRGQRDAWGKQSWCDSKFTKGVFQGGGGEWVAQGTQKSREKRPSAVSKGMCVEETGKFPVVREGWLSDV